MKPSFFVMFFLLQLLAAIVCVSFAQDSSCACENLGSVVERLFVPGETTPLDQDCLDVENEPRLQDVQDLADPSGTAFTRFLLTKDDCDDTGEDFLCELSDVAGSQLDTFHEETNFHYFVNVDGISGECYSPQTYHYHKVSCSGFWMINLCVPNTMDLPASEQGCSDEIRIGEPPLETHLCGRAEADMCLVGLNGGDVNPLSGQFELIGFGDFEMTTGTTQCCGGCGYRFSVTCLDAGQFRRKKRSIIAQKNIEGKMRKRFPPLPRSARSEVRNIVIQNGEIIDYVGGTIIVLDDAERVLHKFKGIAVFQVYDVLTGYSTFYSSLEKITFEGYGYLMIGCGIARYLYERAPPYLQLTEQDIEDIQNFVPLIHEGLYNQTNQPNSTKEVTFEDDYGSGDKSKKHGKKPVPGYGMGHGTGSGKGPGTGSSVGPGKRYGKWYRNEPGKWYRNGPEKWYRNGYGKWYHNGPGKWRRSGPEKRHRDRRNTGLGDLEGQCDPMCPDNTSSDFISCTGAQFESQGRRRRQTGKLGSANQDLKKIFKRAFKIVKDPNANPFVVRYANAFIFFFYKVHTYH